MSRLTLAIFALAAAGFSPFRAEERNVREGNARVAAGDPAGALPHYDAAERAAGPRPEIDFDRGVALHRAGRAADARDAFRKARAAGTGALASRASQNLGNALAALGDRDGAKAAFVEALREDPGNEDARFDLEVLLRQEQAERRRSPPAQQPQQQRAAQDQPAEGSDRRSAETPPRAPEPRPAEPAPAGAGSDAQQARAPAEPGGDPRPLSREEAERILDALGARERPMPLGVPKRGGFWGTDADRDW